MVTGKRTNEATSIILSLLGAEQSMTNFPPTLPLLPFYEPQKIIRRKQLLTSSKQTSYTVPTYRSMFLTYRCWCHDEDSARKVQSIKRGESQETGRTGGTDLYR